MRQREEKSINILEAKSSACKNHGNVTIKLNSCCTSNLSHLRRPIGAVSQVGKKSAAKLLKTFASGFRRRFPDPTDRPWPPRMNLAMRHIDFARV